MVSYFQGCNNLMTIIIFLMFFYFSFPGTSNSVVAGRENRLAELSSREDLVQMAGYGEEKLSTVLVSGTVVCWDEEAQNHPHPVSDQNSPKSMSEMDYLWEQSSHGHVFKLNSRDVSFSEITCSTSSASVAVLCHSGGKTRKSNWARGFTDEYGDFLIDLPSHLHAFPNLEKICLVKVLQLPKNSVCQRPAFTGEHKGMELSSVGNGIRTYTAQRIHLKSKPSKEITKTGGRKEEMLLYAY